MKKSIFTFFLTFAFISQMAFAGTSAEDLEGIYEVVRSSDADYFCKELQGLEITLWPEEEGLYIQKHMTSGKLSLDQIKQINTGKTFSLTSITSSVKARHIFKNGQLLYQESSKPSFLSFGWSSFKTRRVILSVQGKDQIIYNFGYGDTNCLLERVSQ